MVWFKVDDKLHSHPKAGRASLAAMGLWALAGSWCGDHTTNGRVPEHMIPSLSRGATELADELVAVGLWVRVKGGYRFHQWLKDGDGSKRNPSKKEVEELRQKKADAGRKGGIASGIARSKPEAGASTVLDVSLNPRPDPTRPEEGGRAGEEVPPAPGAPGPEPPPKCSDHEHDPKPPPCGTCAEARKAHNQWEITKAKWDRAAPKCPKHRGQRAHNCSICQSERKGAS